MVLLIDETGTIVKSLHDPSGQVVSRVSEALEINDELIVGSFFEPFIAKVTLD